MLSRSELYGGSTNVNFTFSGELITMPDGTDVRIWILSSDDFAGVGNAIRLPDPLTIRRAPGAAPPGAGAVGGVLYYIVNLTTFNNVNLEDSEGNVLGFIDIGEMFVVSLFNPFVAGGTWCVMKKTAFTGAGGISTNTISFGSGTSLFNQARSYSYENDVWTNKTGVPIVGGSVDSATAAEVVEASAPADTFTAVMHHFNLHRFQDTGGGGIYTALQSPIHEAAHTGLADSSGGLFATSSLRDMFYVTNAGVGGTPRTTEIYSITLDSWSSGPNTPAAVNAFGETVSCDEGFDGAINTAIFICPTAPDSSTGWYALTLFTTVYQILRNPPWPWGHAATSVIGLGGTMHLQNGNYDAGGLPNPGFSTDSHYEYAKFLDVWSALPRSPVVARGMGIRGTSLYRDRYTFGMGADKDAPGTPFVQHFEYNLSTRSYRSRATISWADSDRREGAWARMKPV